MADSGTLSRALSVDEVAELAPSPDGDTETPTTSLVDVTSRSSAEAHFPGVASPAKSAAAYDTVPDPVSVKEK